MCAPAGQALIFCSTNLHAGWHNELEVSRKTLLMAFAPQGVPCGSPFGQVEGQGLKFFRGLRPKMRPERAHLVPDEADWPYFFESPDGGQAANDLGHSAAVGNYTREWLEEVTPLRTPKL